MIFKPLVINKLRRFMVQDAPENGWNYKSFDCCNSATALTLLRNASSQISGHMAGYVND
jgi:hypothetical protein